MIGENVSSWWKILTQQVCLGNSGEFVLLYYVSLYYSCLPIKCEGGGGAY